MDKYFNEYQKSNQNSGLGDRTKKHRVERRQRELEFSEDIHRVGQTLFDADKIVISNLEVIKNGINFYMPQFYVPVDS